MSARITRIQLSQRTIRNIEDQVTSTHLAKMADDVIRLAAQDAPRSDGTNSFTDGIPGNTSGGRLADSLKRGFVTDRGKKIIRIFSDATNSRGEAYAGFVVRGTRPHVISARRAANLAFHWINRNTFMITDQVQHPGSKPNKAWLTNALRRVFH